MYTSISARPTYAKMSSFIITTKHNMHITVMTQTDRCANISYLACLVQPVGLKSRNQIQFWSQSQLPEMRSVVITGLTYLQVLFYDIKYII